VRCAISRANCSASAAIRSAMICSFLSACGHTIDDTPIHRWKQERALRAARSV